MRVVASGLVYDGRAHPPHGRACRRTTLALTADGTVLVSFRRGSAQRSIDGHPVVLASSDLGRSWTIRYDGHGRTALEGVPGEMLAYCIAEPAPGALLATSFWIDHSDPGRPFQNPVTGGFLPMRIFHVRSEDGGRSWSEPRIMDTRPHTAATPETNAAFRVAGGTVVQPHGLWKEYDDPGVPQAGPYLRFSHDDGATWPEWLRVAKHPVETTFYWDQRLAIHPDSGRLVNVFWTRDSLAERDLDAHVSWGSPDARTWTAPVPIGLPAQYFQPVALGGDRLAGVWADRALPGVVVSLSDDFGRTWRRADDLVLHRSGPHAAASPSAPRPAGLEGASTYIGDAIAGYTFGHPRAALLPTGELLVVWYSGDDTGMDVRWARVALA